MGKIKDGSLDFTIKMQMSAALDAITLDDLLTYYENLFHLECKKVSIQIFAKEDGVTNLPSSLLDTDDTYCTSSPILVKNIFKLQAYPRYPNSDF